MSNYRAIIPAVLRTEGGASSALTDNAAKHPGNADGPRDSRGRIIHTNKGIQWRIFKDLAPQLGYSATHALFLQMPMGIWEAIWKIGYWDAVSADQIKDVRVASLLAHEAWASGPRAAAMRMQTLLNQRFGQRLTVDGVVGPRTLAAINAQPGFALADAFNDLRLRVRQQLVADGIADEDNLEGWKRALDIIYDAALDAWEVVREGGK